MKRSIQIYVEGVKLDLFNDEQIQVNSTVQNISDISKVYCDFSQSFSVPATPNNNKVFSHFYNSEVFKYNSTQFDVNIRKDAQIDINLTAFRTGKIQLEKANIKKGKPESYQITFYGDITSLKDKFAEDLLGDVDLSSLDHLYNGTEVFNRITDNSTNYEVRYPLISSKRNWVYGGGSADDITDSTGRIDYLELFPAVKISSLFNAIASHYGLTFNGTFLSDQRFTDCFLWGKTTNANTLDFITQPQRVDFVLGFADGGVINVPFDFTNDTLSYSDQFFFLANTSYPSGYFNRRFRTRFTIYDISSATATWYIDLYKDGILYSTTQGTGNSTQTYTLLEEAASPGLSSTLYMEVRSSEQMSFKTRVYCDELFDYNDTSTTGVPIISTDVYSVASYGPSQTLTGNSNLAGLVPEMKVADFFSGILKVFNLTCYGTAANTFQIEPLDIWYQVGDIHDITKYTDIDSIDVDRVPLYKRIKLKYQESDSILNKQYKALFQKNYGDDDQDFSYDGSEFNVELPFENLMGQRFDNTTTQVAYALTENLDPYTPKPCLFYMYERQATDVKLYNGSSVVDLVNYMPFGQDLLFNGVDNYSLNFGPAMSTFLLQPVQDGLTKTYYISYLLNLYDLQNRLVSVKTQLPISLLTKLRLNDRLIIRDKRYVINEMKSNLTSGEVNFTLLLDFRDILPVTVIPSPSGAGCVDVPINLPNGVCSAAIATSTPGVTITPSSVTSSQIIEVCVPANANPQTFIVTEDTNLLFPPILYKYVNTEDNFRIVTEGSANQTIVLTVTFTYCNGAVDDQTIVIQQP